MWWQLGALANCVVAVAYFAISSTILRALARSGQLRSNQLALATGVIFFTCSVGHGLHAAHLLAPAAFDLDPVQAEGLRAAFSWHMAPWDALTALVGCWYWTLRTQYGALLKGPGLFNDMKADRRQAMELNDDVVQSLAVAKYALSLGQPERAMAAIDQSLESARSIITTLLGEQGRAGSLGPGDLVRQRAAGTADTTAPATQR